MAAITAQLVKQLRDITGAGPLDSKKALEQFDGDIDKAVTFLREKGLAKAAKKLGAGRAMNEGLVDVYLHFNKRLGVMVEVNCETDFVAATDAFKDFVSELARHVANLAPQYIRREDVPEAVVTKEREIQTNRALEEGKPAAIAEKVAEGRMAKFYEEIVLLEQKYFRDEEKTIAQLLQETVATVGESIQIARFSRFAIGENSSEE